MIPVHLPNIDPKKVEQARLVLDDLVTQTIISGYNWYDRVSDLTRVVTFSHLHETEDYRQAMSNDMQQLGYSAEDINNNTRPKSGCYRWERDFVFRDDNGNVFPNLIVRRASGEYLDLAKYPEKTLANVPELKNERLYGENKGWELDLEFKTKENLLQLVALFLNKSSKKTPGHWPGAYDVPVLIIGEQAKAYASELPDFIEAKRLVLVENGNEISFIIHERFEDLLKHSAYQVLSGLGFTVESCLGNKTFVAAYVDKR